MFKVVVGQFGEHVAGQTVDDRLAGLAARAARVFRLNTHDRLQHPVCRVRLIPTQTSPRSAFYGGRRRGTTRVCCCAPCSNRSISPARRARRVYYCCCRGPTQRQTDGQMDARPLLRPCSACYAVSGSNPRLNKKSPKRLKVST